MNPLLIAAAIAVGAAVPLQSAVNARMGMSQGIRCTAP